MESLALKKPNIVILTIGRTGSTVLCQILRAMGWHVPSADRIYEENLHFRRLNTSIRERSELDHAVAQSWLDALPSPWVLKDPRLLVTWNWWHDKFDPDTTLLLHLSRNLADVEASLRRKFWGEVTADGFRIRGLSLPEAEERCRQILADWPGPKCHVHYDQLAAAAKLFDPDKQARAIAVQKRAEIVAKKNPKPATHSYSYYSSQQFKWAVGVTTAPRDPETLTVSVASLKNAGFPTPFVFAEPDTQLISPDAHIVQRPNTLAPSRFPHANKFGAWCNWIQALTDLVHHLPYADAYLLCQDDIQLCRDTRRFLDHDLWPDPEAGMVSIYSSSIYEKPGLPHCRQIDGQFIVGAVATIFPRVIAHQIVNPEYSANWRGVATGKSVPMTRKKAIDTYIGHVVARLKKTVWYYSPSLVQHTSPHSSLGHGGNTGKRRSQHFPGPDASAPIVYRDQHPRDHYTLPSGRTRKRARKPILAIIPGREMPELTVRCLESLMANTDWPIRVVYVDDGTERQADVIATIREAADSLRCPLETHAQPPTGFTAAVNQGLSALQSDEDALILNNDCFVAPNCIARLARRLYAAPKIAAVGPLTCDHGHHSLRQPRRRAKAGLQQVPSDPSDLVGVAAQLTQHVTSDENMLVFFCTLIRGDAISDVGRLDDDPVYAAGLGADDEWCRRARAHGWKLRICYDTYAQHQHSATFRRLRLDRKSMQKSALQHFRNTDVIRTK